MTTTAMNISLPEALKDYVKGRVAEGTYSTPSDYVRDLIRSDMQRRAGNMVDDLLLDGLASGPAEDVTPAYLATLRAESDALVARKRKPK